MVGKSLLGKVYIIIHRKRICTFECIQYIYLCSSVLHVTEHETNCSESLNIFHSFIVSREKVHILRIKPKGLKGFCF